MKTKTCGICLKEGPLWKARTKDTPGLCKNCAGKSKSSPKMGDKVFDVGFSGVVTAIKPTPIANVSDKQKKINAAYKILRKRFMERNAECQAKFSGCTFYATECHHSEGRGKNVMLDDSTYRALCSSCHKIAENNPDFAIENGISNKRLNKK